MGATTFFNYGVGKNAEDAFHALVEEAQWEHGHGGYTGTIAEKGSFVVFEPPSEMSARTFVQWVESMEFDNNGQPHFPDTESVNDLSAYAKQVILNAAKVYDDKWGPALCVPVSIKEFKEFREFDPKKGNKAFIFCGWASE